MLVFHVAGTVPTRWFFRYRATLLLESGRTMSVVGSAEDYKNYIVVRLFVGVVKLLGSHSHAFKGEG